MHSFFDAPRSLLVCLSIIAGAADPALSATKDSERVFQKIDELRRIPVWTRANVEKSLKVRTNRFAVWYWRTEKSPEFKAVNIVIDRQGNVCAVDLEFPDEVDIRVSEIETRYGNKTSKYRQPSGNRNAAVFYVYGKPPSMTFEVSEAVRPPRALMVILTSGAKDAKPSRPK